MEAHEAFERFEKSHEATGHGGGGHEADRYGRNAAVVVSILAAFLAVATFLANEAIKEAIQGETKVAALDARYNSLNTQGILANLNGALLGAISINSPAAAELQKAAKQLEDVVPQKVDPGKKELEAENKVRTKEVSHANDQHLLYELAEVGLQIGIVLASISIIARRHWLLVGGGAMGCVGVVILAVGLLS
ncbi:MAG TPA: DUF4337 family protein [Solirubrobacteraceae bacterium]|jgi:hypothetical protein|nr:DUF4337 family protein [Solirubrobacteraceae bacterium]